MTDKDKARLSKEFLTGIPELLVLRLLADGEKYGYEIVRDIKLRSHNSLRFGEGVIYPMLHAMQHRRMLAIRRQTVNGRERIYYRLTSKGKKQLTEKVSQWQQLTEIVQQFLGGGDSVGQPAS